MQEKFAPTCATCRFSKETPTDPATLQRARMCQWGPPGFVMMPGPGGFAPGFGFPIVQDGNFCHQHKEIDAPKLLT